MTEKNGKQNVVSVTLEEGKMNVNFGAGISPVMISHALRMASLTLDNILISQQAKADEDNKSSIIPVDVMNRMK